ncbi:hypothetical protein Tco_0684219 [Tanacetum coccineum]
MWRSRWRRVCISWRKNFYKSKKAWGEVGRVENKSSTGSKLIVSGEELFWRAKVGAEEVWRTIGDEGGIVGDLLNGDVPFLDIVTKEVMMDFDMFGPRVENGIFA